jgi:hypothetical protein
LRGVLYDWLKEKTFWRIQEDLFSSREPDAYRRAKGNSPTAAPLVIILTGRAGD